MVRKEMNKQRIKTHARTPEQETLAKKRRNLSQLINKLELCLKSDIHPQLTLRLREALEWTKWCRRELGTFKTDKE
jgi:hypothetical protein